MTERKICTQAVNKGKECNSLCPFYVRWPCEQFGGMLITSCSVVHKFIPTAEDERRMEEFFRNRAEKQTDAPTTTYRYAITGCERK